ncbi:site-specific integrase [Marinobacterium maritimum]|uniref:Site-specific integrase n=2 Tax=Marinobacterium maritimum TaxID=500162 RepID=A0ABN1I395_9GAMM
MGRRQTTKENAQPIRGVTIRTTAAGTELIQLAFTYKGKRYRKSLNVSPTPQNILAANRRLEQIRLEIQMGSFQLEKHFEPNDELATLKKTPLRELIKERMDRKLRLTGRSGWEQSTYSERLKMFNLHIEPTFGHLTVTELTATHVKNWLKKKTFSLTYGQLLMSIMNPVIEEALADGVIDKHPYKHVKLADYLGQKTTKERKERIDPLSEVEISLLLDKTKDSQERNYLQFMLFSGLRMQEGAVIRWEDVDFKQRTITVCRAVGHDNNKEYLKSTKTGEERIVDLIPPAWEALMNQRKHTRLSAGFVFLPTYSRRDRGYEWPARTYIRSMWTRALNRAGIRSVNRSPKQTRHTFCSLMIAAGKPLTWVAQQAGHSSLAMLEKHYAKAVRLASNKHHDYDFSSALEEARRREEEDQQHLA